MPDAAHAFVTSSKKVSNDGWVVPQELLMMFGRLLASGFAPVWSVGSSSHCPELISAVSDGQQPSAAIQRTPGATPMPVAPAIVPIVWVP